MAAAELVDRALNQAGLAAAEGRGGARRHWPKAGVISAIFRLFIQGEKLL